MGAPFSVGVAVRFARRCGRLLALSPLVLASCSSAAPAKTTLCVPGQSNACAGIHACAGYQVCRSDGAGYGACLCDDGGLRAFPSAGPYSGLLGSACSTGDDCRKGLDCVTRESSLIHGEGPSAGMCLSKCRVDHDFCAEVDATAKCVVLDDGGTTDTSDDVAYCLPGCTLGEQPARADKCRGRVDLVCSEDPVGAGAGYCKPACRSDIDCAPRVCDLNTGLCGDGPRSGDPVGAACDPKNSLCAGGCFSPGGAYSECSGLCSYGTEGCGQTKEPPLDDFCAIGGATAAGMGSGDLGYCARVCDCDDDCQRPDAVCEPEPGLTSKTGRRGICGSKTLPSGGARKNIPCVR